MCGSPKFTLHRNTASPPRRTPSSTQRTSRYERSLRVKPGGQRPLRPGGRRRSLRDARHARAPSPAPGTSARAAARARRPPGHAGCSTSTRYPSGSRTKNRCPPHGRRVGRRQHLGAAGLQLGVDRQAVGDLEHEQRAARPPDRAGATIVTPGPVLGRVALLGERQADPRAGERRVGRVVVARLQRRSPAGRGRRRSSGRPRATARMTPARATGNAAISCATCPRRRRAAGP